MSQRQKFIAQLLAAGGRANLNFEALGSLLRFLGFAERIRGSHHIYTKPGIEEIINIQPAPGGTVKTYQAKQIRELLVRYELVDVSESESDTS